MHGKDLLTVTVTETMNFSDYCKARNSANKAIRLSKVKHQRGAAESAKKSPKSFWAYVKDQTKSVRVTLVI